MRPIFNFSHSVSLFSPLIVYTPCQRLNHLHPTPTAARALLCFSLPYAPHSQTIPLKLAFFNKSYPASRWWQLHPCADNMRIHHHLQHPIICIGLHRILLCKWYDCHQRWSYAVTIRCKSHSHVKIHSTVHYYSHHYYFIHLGVT